MSPHKRNFWQLWLSLKMLLIYVQLLFMPTSIAVIRTIFGTTCDQVLASSTGTKTHHHCIHDHKDRQKFTEQECRAITRFREIVDDDLVHDYEKEDMFLISWLEDYNLAKAQEKFREAKLWRDQYQMDSILNETITNPGAEGGGTANPCIVDGLDNDGSPVVYLNVGAVDSRIWALRGKTDHYYRYMIQCVERAAVKIRNQAKITGRGIAQGFAIADVKGFTLKQHACSTCVKMYMVFAEVTEKYYPQIVKRFIVINVPTFARPVIEILKGALSTSTVKVLKIFGTNKKEWSPYLLKFISEDQLPVSYGGTRIAQGNEE